MGGGVVNCQSKQKKAKKYTKEKPMLNPLLQRVANYDAVVAALPPSGHHINATFSTDSHVVNECISRTANIRGGDEDFAAAADLARCSGIIVFYQAFNEAIVNHAVKHQRFLDAPGFHPTRMTWIKSSFSWCAYRDEYCTRDKDQARQVAITIPCALLDELLSVARDSGASEGKEGSLTTQQHLEKIEKSSMSKDDPTRLQWDPDHTPGGGKMRRRTIQIGMRGKSLEKWHKLMLCIDDVTESLVVPSRPSKFAAQAATGRFRVGLTEPGAGPVVAQTHQRYDDDDDDDEARTEVVEGAIPANPCVVPVEELYVPGNEAIAKLITLDRVIPSDAVALKQPAPAATLAKAV